jgi:hypothetical protein
MLVPEEKDPLERELDDLRVEVSQFLAEIANLQAELRRLKSTGDLLAAAVLGHDSGPPGVDPRVAAQAWAAARSTRPQGYSDE